MSKEMKTTRQERRYHVTWSCFRATIVAVEKHEVLRILSLFVVFIFQHASAYAILLYASSVAIQYFSTLSHKRHGSLNNVI
jgi:hypothetical protein